MATFVIVDERQHEGMPQTYVPGIPHQPVCDTNTCALAWQLTLQASSDMLSRFVVGLTRNRGRQVMLDDLLPIAEADVVNAVAAGILDHISAYDFPDACDSMQSDIETSLRIAANAVSDVTTAADGAGTGAGSGSSADPKAAVQASIDARRRRLLAMITLAIDTCGEGIMLQLPLTALAPEVPDDELVSIYADPETEQLEATSADKQLTYVRLALDIAYEDRFLPLLRARARMLMTFKAATPPSMITVGYFGTVNELETRVTLADFTDTVFGGNLASIHTAMTAALSNSTGIFRLPIAPAIARGVVASLDSDTVTVPGSTATDDDVYPTVYHRVWQALLLFQSLWSHCRAATQDALWIPTPRSDRLWITDILWQNNDDDDDDDSDDNAHNNNDGNDNADGYNDDDSNNNSDDNGN